MMLFEHEFLNRYGKTINRCQYNCALGCFSFNIRKRILPFLPVFFVKIGRAEKLSEGDIKPVTELFDRNGTRSLTLTIYNTFIVDCGTAKMLLSPVGVIYIATMQA